MKGGATSTKALSVIIKDPRTDNESDCGRLNAHRPAGHKLWSRQNYWGSLLFNLGAFILPALYATLSKLWVAQIDSNQVVTTDIYTYIGVIVEVLNEGFPRSAWLLIGDNATRSMRSRLNLACTMITATTSLGFMVMLIFLSYPQSLASAFVPTQVRHASITYVRLSSVQFLTSAAEAALSSSTRALDNPDVPLIISSSKFIVNIVLDLLIISRFHIGRSEPTVVSQATIRLVCDCLSALTGLAYFANIVKSRKREAGDRRYFEISISALKTLLRPSTYTFLESALRNAIYLWIAHEIVQLGEDYATAWGVFNTIRWGLVMVPVLALETSTLTFIGHNWGHFRASKETENPRASTKEILGILRPALMSCFIALIFEVVLFAALFVHGIHAFAYYLSGSTNVATISQRMWKVVDWTYIFYGLGYQIAAVLLATSPRWYLYQALGSNLLWMMPWAIVASTMAFPLSLSWTYYAIIFGGANIFSFVVVSVVLFMWLYRLCEGKIKSNSAHGD